MTPLVTHLAGIQCKVCNGTRYLEDRSHLETVTLVMQDKKLGGEGGIAHISMRRHTGRHSRSHQRRAPALRGSASVYAQTLA